MDEAFRLMRFDSGLLRFVWSGSSRSKEYDIGFSTLDGDGIEIDKIFRSLKHGDILTIIVSKKKNKR